MTPLGRALAGALFGAILTLVLHPVSRPFLLSAPQRVSVGQLKASLDVGKPTPPAPTDLQGASLWIQLGMERLASRVPLSDKESQTLIKIAEQASRLERENAFWHQSLAVFLHASHRDMESDQAWIRASKGTLWNDYQATRLLEGREALASLVGSRQAWQYAYVLQSRSESSGVVIERFARSVLAKADTATSEGIVLRYATLVNGELLRTGAKSIPLGIYGANIVELTAYPSDLQRTTSPKRLWTGQTEFTGQMSRLGMDKETNFARRIFRENENWRALTEYQDPANLIATLTAAAVLTAGTASAIAVLSVTGLFLWAVGMLGKLVWGTERRFPIPFVAALSVLMGGLTFFLTQEILAGVASLLCVGFLNVHPQGARRIQPDDLGPLLNLLVTLLAILFGACFAGYAITQTPAAAALVPYLEVSPEFQNSPLLLGFGVMILSFLLLGTPFWALVQKIGTPQVASLALRKFGAFLGIGSLIIGVLMAPVAVYVDKQIGQTLSQLVKNEPLYHSIRQ